MFAELVQELEEVLSSVELEAPFEQGDFIVLLEYLPELPWNDIVEYVQIVGYDKVEEPVTSERVEKEQGIFLVRVQE